MRTPTLVTTLLATLATAGVPAQERAPAPQPRPGPDGVTIHRDLAYADGDDAWVLDLYLPKTTNTAPPLVAWIHGGGWTRGSKSRVPGAFRRLATDGYAVASIEYRLTGLQSHPDQVHDCKAAIRWLRANAETYGYDASRIGVGGASAGGNRSWMLATSCWPSGTASQRKAEVTQT
jgi:acetyl esterase/lipase